LKVDFGESRARTNILSGSQNSAFKAPNQIEEEKQLQALPQN